MMILSDLQDAYLNLYEAGTAKKDLIIYDRVAELADASARETALLNRIAERMKDWNKAVIELQERTGRSTGEQLSYRQVGALISDADDAAAYEQALARVDEAARALRALNERNQQLLQQSIELVGDVLDQAVGPAEMEVSYGDPSAAQKSARRTGGFDYRM